MGQDSVKLRCVGHVSRMVTNRWEKKILDWPPYDYKRTARNAQNKMGGGNREVYREVGAKHSKRLNLLGECRERIRSKVEQTVTQRWVLGTVALYDLRLCREENK